MKNPACQFPVPDQNLQHFVKQCHTRFPDANNGVSVLCTDCTTPPYLNNGIIITAPYSTSTGQYIPPTCDGCIIEPLVIIPSVPDSGPYTVTYSSNGNSGNPPTDSALYTYGSQVTVSANNEDTPVSPFTGWNTAANGSGTAYAPGSTFTITANTILYAMPSSRL
jgi:hypothetical protein